MIARPVWLRLLALTLLLAAAPARAQVLNPDFEEGADPGGSTKLSQGSQVITHWTVSGDALYYAGTDWAPADGTRSVGLYTNAPATRSAIRQMFSTEAGAAYVLIFMYAAAPLDGPCLDRVLSVHAAGRQTTFTTHGVGTASDPQWRIGTWAFTAVADSTTLEFANEYDAQACGLLVDRVLVTTPLPVRPTSWGALRARYRK